MSGRLQVQDYKAIILKGQPWKDPLFPHGKYALFMNHQAPQKQNTESKKKWVEDYVWKRASQHFGEGNFKMFDGIDPTDVIMGSVNDCYAFAALSGLANARIEELDFDPDK